jgi:hypothetical protein
MRRNEGCFVDCLTHYTGCSGGREGSFEMAQEERAEREQRMQGKAAELADWAEADAPGPQLRRKRSRKLSIITTRRRTPQLVGV